MNPDVFALAALILLLFVVLAPPGHHFEAKCSPRPTQVAQVYYFDVCLCDFGRPFAYFGHLFSNSCVFVRQLCCEMASNVPPHGLLDDPLDPMGRKERKHFGVAKCG